MTSQSGWHRKRTTPAELERRREYNSTKYRETRKALARVVAAGDAYCWRPDCHRYIPPGTRWHCGHDDHDRSIIRGIECVRCNLKAAARKGARIRNAHQDRWATSRQW